MSTAARVQQYIERHCTISQRGKQWRCTSPLRTDSDSSSFSIEFIGDEFGRWYDHVSKDGGSLYDLADRLEIETGSGAKRHEIGTTKREYTDLADYAQAHGVSVDVFAAAGWRDGEKYGRKCIAFPTANGTRYRFLDGQGAKYINDTGYSACWYGLDKAIAQAKRRNTPLVLCNGEASTVVAHHYGLPAFCKTNGEGKIPDKMLDELSQKWAGQVVIALDCDEAGRSASVVVYQQITNAVLIDLNLSKGGDLADFCKLHAEDAFDTLWTLMPDVVEEMDYRTTSAKLMESRIAEAITNMATPGAIRGLRSGNPELDKAISGFQSQVYTVVASTGMGKTTLMSSWATYLASQAPGLIFCTEIPSELFLDKMACSIARINHVKVMDGYITGEELNRLEAAYRTLAACEIEFIEDSLTGDELLRRSIEAQKKWGCSWVIVDSMTRLAQAAEYEAVTNIANVVQEICKKCRIPVIATAQIGRSTKDRSNKMPTVHDAKASGQVEENADLLLGLYRHDYYVTLGECQPDERFPPGTAVLTVLKDRWRGNGGRMFQMASLGGVGYYPLSEEVPL